MARSRRRRSPDPVRHRRVAFIDGRDSIRPGFYDRGAAYVSARQRRPPVGAYRFLSLVKDRAVPDSLARFLDPLAQLRSRVASLWGYGAHKPHASLLRPANASVRVSAAVGRSPIRPLQALRPSTWDGLASLRVPVPRQAAFCVRRKLRREVMFAKHVAGRRGSAPGPYHRTADSHWTC